MQIHICLKNQSKRISVHLIQKKRFQSYGGVGVLFVLYLLNLCQGLMVITLATIFQTFFSFTVY